MAVSVSEVESLNKSKGSIYAPELKANLLQEINECKTIIDNMVQLSSWNADPQVRVMIPAYTVTFKTRKVPETVTVDFMRHAVKEDAFWKGRKIL